MLRLFLDDRGWDGWMASPIQWTWVWVDSRSWWWTERPGMLRLMGCQRVGHDWATELNWAEVHAIAMIRDLGSGNLANCFTGQICWGVPVSAFPQYFPALGSFLMSQLFISGGQSIGVSASASLLPMNTQDWSPLGWTGWISLQSKGLSRVFSNTTV